MRGFYTEHPEFERVPLYIYGQSYGGKMAIDMGIRIREVSMWHVFISDARNIGLTGT